MQIQTAKQTKHEHTQNRLEPNEQHNNQTAKDS